MTASLVYAGWQVYAEGGANVLYANEGALAGQLLRLRKKHKYKVSTKEVYDFMKDDLVPYLGDVWIIHFELVRIPRGFYSVLGNSMEKLDLGEEYGLLVENARFTQIEDINPSHKTDLTYGSLEIRELQHGTTSVFLEFKPKWLIQSPNAPVSAKCCRTCAHRAMTQRPKGFCPLDLGSGDPYRIRRAVKTLLGSVVNYNGIPLEDIVTTYFVETSLLQALRRLQALDSRGILNYHESKDLDKNFFMAMSSRDCTLFLEIFDQNIAGDTPVIVNGTSYWVKAKLADLDLKNPKKRSQWAAVESKLQPWYSNIQFSSVSTGCQMV
jgi:inositol-pentakisphosphate 2-kinase